MKNQQPPEKRIPVSSVGCPDLDVHSIFYTIQGEGPFAGTPAVFIRLAGCNLQCPGCDTEYTAGRKTMGPFEVLFHVNEAIRKNRHRSGLVVITGGEPFRQPQALTELCKVLTSNRYYVQIETNGTLAITSRYEYSRNIAAKKGVYIVASPKTTRVHPTIDENACAFKYVMDHRNVEFDGLPKSALDHTVSLSGLARHSRSDIPIYLQPRDEQDDVINKANLDACINSCMEHGYILQLQIHKIIGME